MKLTLNYIVPLLFFTTMIPVFGQTAEPKTIVGLNGQCEFTMVDPTAPLPCQRGVLWMILQNGLSIVVFAEGNNRTTFALSGGRDRQPDPEDYYLGIDTFRMIYSGKETVDNGMEGECHFNLNEDGTKYYYIKCLIYNRRIGTIFHFDLNNVTDFNIKNF
jgi:hypothetical protein